MTQLRTLWKTKGILLLVSTGCALEFLYAPKIPAWNGAGVFPSIPVGVRFSIMEALVGSFVVIIGGYILTKRAGRRGVLCIAPSGYKTLTGLFLLSIVLSLGVGVVLRAPSLVTEVREFIIPGMLFFIFVNIHIEKEVEYRVIQLLYWTGLASLAIGYLVFFFPSSVPGNAFIIGEGGFWVALYSGVFAAVWASSQLVWKGLSLNNFLILSTALGAFFLHISHKPILFTFFISLFAVVFCALFSGKTHVVSRARRLGIVLPLVPVSTFVVLPQSLKSEVVKVFAWRYLKVQNITSLEELQSSFDQVGQKQDLSAGRFGIWESYFQDAASGLGLAPDGLGGAAEVYTSLQGYEPGFPAHNTVAYLSYHAGYVASISYVLIVGLFLYQGFRYLPRRRRQDSVFETVDLVAIFSFTVGIIAVGLVGGPLKDYRLAWFFWFGVAVLARRWSALVNNNYK